MCQLFDLFNMLIDCLRRKVRLINCRFFSYSTVVDCCILLDSPQCSSKFLIPSPIYTGLGRLINLTCHMINGNPSTNNFTWHLPNGRIVLGNYHNSTSSYLSFVPKTSDDFGSISCRAENALGLYDQCQLKMSLGG